MEDAYQKRLQQMRSQMIWAFARAVERVIKERLVCIIVFLDDRH